MSSSRRAAKTECIVLRAKGGRGGEKGGRRGVGSEGLRSCERRGGRTSVCCALTVAGWWLAGRGGGANGARLRRLAVWGAREGAGVASAMMSRGEGEAREARK